MTPVAIKIICRKKNESSQTEDVDGNDDFHGNHGDNLKSKGTDNPNYRRFENESATTVTNGKSLNNDL